MFAQERQKRILDMLERDGSVFVSKLAVDMSVTEETIRRDLEKLEAQELLIRTHGGAVQMSKTSVELSLEKRKKTNVEEKRHLALAACAHIMPGDTVFLDASTTTFYMAKELRDINNLTIVTNSLRVINELSDCPNIKIISPGGLVSSNMSFVGEIAQKTISEKFFAAKFFFSSRGTTATGGILESNENERAIKRVMLKNSGEVYYLCDASKIGKIGFEKLAEFSEIDYFITDAVLDEAMGDALVQNNVKVEKVDEEKIYDNVNN